MFFDVCLRFKLVGKAEASVSDGQERAKQTARRKNTIRNCKPECFVGLM